MGKAIAEEAKRQGLEITATIDPHADDANYKDLTPESIRSADVCIEFSRPDTVMKNIQLISEAGKPVVIGTTGWYDQMPKVEDLVNQYQVGAIYAQNFSLGMNFYLKILENAASLVDQIDEYDISGYEMHHSQKVDSPSGTAEAIVDTLLKQISRKERACYDKAEEKIDPKSLHMASIRCGSVPGTHSVMMDSSFDTITLTHQARNRDGWTKGALVAAKWIQGKKGLHHISELF